MIHVATWEKSAPGRLKSQGKSFEVGASLAVQRMTRLEKVVKVYSRGGLIDVIVGGGGGGQVMGDLKH